MNPEDQRTNCPGFLDEYGIWNNGFECPILSDQLRVCCGSDSRRYCCTLEYFHTTSEKSFLSTNVTTFSLIKKFNLNFLTLPIQLTCILIIILLLLLILIILLICYRYHKQKSNSLEQEKYLSTKQTLIIDHFPFSPPHHRLFFNENNQQIKDTLTISTSSLSARIPSDIYYNDRKEFFNPTEQSIIRYPIIPSHYNEINNYLFDDKYQQDDIIV